MPVFSNLLAPLIFLRFIEYQIWFHLAFDNSFHSSQRCNCGEIFEYIRVSFTTQKKIHPQKPKAKKKKVQNHIINFQNSTSHFYIYRHSPENRKKKVLNPLYSFPLFIGDGGGTKVSCGVWRCFESERASVWWLWGWRGTIILSSTLDAESWRLLRLVDVVI